MGKGRFIDKKEYMPVNGAVASAFNKPTVDVAGLRARIAELEREIEHLKKEHELELENLQLRFEAQVKKLQSELQSAFPLATRLLNQFDNLLTKEIEAAKAAGKQG